MLHTAWNWLCPCHKSEQSYSQYNLEQLLPFWGVLELAAFSYFFSKQMLWGKLSWSPFWPYRRVHLWTTVFFPSVIGMVGCVQCVLFGHRWKGWVVTRISPSAVLVLACAFHLWILEAQYSLEHMADFNSIANILYFMIKRSFGSG